MYYINKRNLRSYEPRTETNYITFRRVVLIPKLTRPVPIEVVRCNENFAFVEADRTSGYLLEKVESTNLDETVFNIYGKFGFEDRSADEGVELPVHQVRFGNPASTAPTAQRFPVTNADNRVR